MNIYDEHPELVQKYDKLVRRLIYLKEEEDALLRQLVHYQSKKGSSGHRITSINPIMILLLLARGDVTHARELQAGTNLTNLTYILKGLEKMGFIERLSNEDDARAKGITLTWQGEEWVENVVKLWADDAIKSGDV